MMTSIGFLLMVGYAALCYAIGVYIGKRLQKMEDEERRRKIRAFIEACEDEGDDIE